MKFQVSSQLDMDVASPLAFVLSVRAQNTQYQRVVSERFHLSANVPHEVIECAATGTRFDRIHAELPGLFTVRYEAEVEVDSTRIASNTLVSNGPETFEADVMTYLYASRYCQTDRLGRFTNDLFGHLETPEMKVREVVDWIGKNISYVSGSTNVGTTAVDTLVERAGVCRDFAHLGIALCRAMNIPARYFTAYAHDLNPPDFHACFETWVGNRWLLWDATGLASPDGVVRIGTGRDAADCSVCTAFGSLVLQRMSVECRVIGDGYVKMTPEEIASSVVSLDAAEPDEAAD